MTSNPKHSRLVIQLCLFSTFFTKKKEDACNVRPSRCWIVRVRLAGVGSNQVTRDRLQQGRGGGQCGGGQGLGSLSLEDWCYIISVSFSIHFPWSKVSRPKKKSRTMFPILDRLIILRHSLQYFFQKTEILRHLKCPQMCFSRTTFNLKLKLKTEIRHLKCPQMSFSRTTLN